MMSVIEIFRKQGIELYERDGSVHCRTKRPVTVEISQQLRFHRQSIKTKLRRRREIRKRLLAAAPFWQSDDGQRLHDRFAFAIAPVPGMEDIAACVFDGTRSATVNRESLVMFFEQHSEQTLIFDDAVPEMEKIRQLVGDEFDIDAMLEQNRVRSTLDLHNLLLLGTTGAPNDPGITLAARCIPNLQNHSINSRCFTLEAI